MNHPLERYNLVAIYQLAESNLEKHSFFYVRWPNFLKDFFVDNAHYVYIPMHSKKKINKQGFKKINEVNFEKWDAKLLSKGIKWEEYENIQIWQLIS